MPDGNKAYYISFFVTSGILIPFFGVLLWKVKNGSGYQFVKTIVWLLMVSNLAAIAFAISTYEIDDAYEYTNWAIIMQFVSIAVQYICFNQAQWIFAHEYDQTSKIMPCALANQPVPESVIKSGKCKNKVLLAANSTAGMLLGVFFYLDNTYAEQAKMNGEKNAYLVVFSLSGISVLFVLILQMVSAVVVGLAIKRIRAFVNAGNTNDEIKVSQLFKHVAALGLNVLGGLTYIISSAFLITAKYNAIDEQETGKQLAWVNASVILTNTLSFASQLFLCWIFWNLASKEPEQTPEVKTEQSEYSAESRLSGEPVVLIEECDENSDLQARLWNQFIRRKQVNEFILARVDRDGNYTGGMVVNTEQIKQSMVSSIVSRSSAQSEKDIYARYKTANNQPTEELMIVRIQDNTATSIIDEEKV